jgi:hypothetical protein
MKKIPRTRTTWQADLFEAEVDEDSNDATDYAVIVTGLPYDAGVHEVSQLTLNMLL